MVDFSFYTSEYGGNTISSLDFKQWITKADYYVENIIAVNKNYIELTTEVQRSIDLAKCNIADMMYNAKGYVNITSERVGDWSRNYDNSKISRQLYDTLTMYLRYTGLMFAGIGLSSRY